MTFWDRLDRVADDWSVLRHSFYERWSRGELTRDELAAYSGQYRHAVVALAAASGAAEPHPDPATREHLAEHAAEEGEHVELWDRFVAATGGDTGADAAPETLVCAGTWARDGRSADETLAALYAIESAQPAIAETKLRGLVDHYGFEPGDATVYFDVHTELDHEHAAAHRELLESAVGQGRDDELIAAARDALAATWALLDGVERTAR